MGAQGQTRSSIVGAQATSLDAQKQFLANVEDAINRPVDLPSDIARYEDTLRYAKSKVDFVFYPGLYMAPSDMELNIGTTNYNEIVVAPSSSTPGHDININTDRELKPKKVVQKIVGNSRENSPGPLATVDFPHKKQRDDTPIMKIRDDHEDQKTAHLLFSSSFGKRS